MFRNTLFLKIILVFTLPALGMMYFSTVLVYEKVQTLSSVDNIQKNIKYLYTTKNLIDAIIKERESAINFILTRKQVSLLEQSSQITNEKYNLFLKRTSHLSSEDKSFILNLKTFQELFYNMKHIREKIYQNQITPLQVLDEYKKITHFLISTLRTVKAINFATDFNSKFTYISDLIILKDNASEELLILNILRQNKKYQNVILNKLVENYTIQDIHLKKFLLNASVEEINRYSDEISLYLINKIQKFRNIVANEMIEEIPSQTFHQRISALQNIYIFVYFNLENLGDKIKKEASVEQFLSLSFLFVSFVTLISLLFVLKNIIFNEQKSFNKINKQQAVYKLLNATNNYLLTSKDEKKLYKEICKLIALTQSMSFGFVYKVGKNGTSLIAQEGKLKHILDIKLQESKNRENLITKALDTQKNVIVENFEKENISVLSDIAKEYQLRSAGAFPIKRFGKVIAVLVLYSNEVDFFDNEVEILFNNMINDMTHSLEKLRYEKARVEHEHELKIAAYAFESNEPMIITDQTAHIIKANQAFCMAMGYTKQEIIGRNPNMFKSDHHDKSFYKDMWKTLLKEGAWSGEIYNCTKSKKLVPMRSTLTAIKDNSGQITHFLGQYLDISEQVDREKVLEYQATHDNLTGLPNRLLLLDRIERVLTKIERHKTIGGLIFIDLDNFKTINDTLGHEIGDKLLILVANKLLETIRKEDTIARIGGDEFIVLADNLGVDYDEAHLNMQYLSNKIKLALNSIIEIDGHKNISTPSMGVTLFSDASNSTQELIKQADTAMYEAKKQGKNSISFFNEA